MAHNTEVFIKYLQTITSEISNSLSIRKKIVCLFLVFSLGPILIIGFISYFSSRETITKRTVEYSLDALTQTVVNIQLKMAEFENISVRLFINKEFNNTVAYYAKGKDNNSIPKKVIEDYFREYMISNQDIFAFLFICNPDVNKSIIITKDYYNDFLNLTHHFQQTNSYHSIVKAGGGIVWSNTVKLSRNNFVILGRYLKDVTSGEPLGVLAIVIDEDKIDQLSNLIIYNRLNISISNIEDYSLIINNDGEIISSPLKEDIGKNIAGFMNDNNSLKLILGNEVSNRDRNEINQGSFITKLNNKQTLVTYKSIGSKIGVSGKSGWYLLSLMPTSFLYENVKVVGFITVILSIIFGVCAIFVALYVASLVNKA